MGRTLAELGEMDSREFTLWLAYDEVEGVPWPWMQTGIQAAVTANAFKGKRGQAARPQDFMPVRRAARRQTAEEQMAIVEGIGRRLEVH